LITACVGTAFQNTLLKESQKGWIDEEEVGNYWMTLRKGQDTGTWNRSTRTHSMDNSLWKRLWACRKTD